MFLSTALAYAVITHSAISPFDWNVTLSLLALSGLVWFHGERGGSDHRSDRVHLAVIWAALLIPLYAAFQLIPLPLGVLRLIDPERVELVDPLKHFLPAGGFAPLSIAPSATWIALSYAAGYALVFFGARGIAGNFQRKPWIAAFPLIAIGGLEAAHGLAQNVAGLLPVSGDYYSRDHFAGLLEMTVPFTIMFGFSFLRRRRPPAVLSSSSVAKACAAFAVAIAMFIAVMESRSKLGFFSLLGSFAVMAAVGFRTELNGWSRWLASIGAIAAVAGLVFLFLPPDELANQLAAAATDPTAEGRWPMAKDTLRVIASYPMFGSGAGTFYYAFLRHQTTQLEYAVANPHNDYLQALAELGIAGFLLAAVFAGGVFLHAVRTAVSRSSRDARYLGLACTGGLAALLIHSFGDFNLHSHANAIVFAWIAGITASLSRSDRNSHANVPQRPELVTRWVVALGAFAAIYAGAWLVFLTYYKDRPSVEHAFCRFGICDTGQSLNVLEREHGNDVAAVPETHLTEFLSREPAEPDRWEDLGEHLLKSGRVAEARYAFSRAVELAPYIAPVLGRAARFHFAVNESAQGLTLMNRALESNSQWIDDGFDAYEECKIPLNDILKTGLPQSPEVWRLYLRRQIQTKRLVDAADVWKTSIQPGYADDALARDYVNFLLNQHQPEAAAAAWGDYARGRDAAYPEFNRVFNAGFESDPAQQSPFDWRTDAVAGVQAVFDPEVHHQGKRSLRLELDGARNLTDAGVHESAFLKPGNYQFRAWVRSKDLSTDQGIAFRVRDEKGKLNFTTEPLLGSTDWKLIRREFAVPAGTGLVQISWTRTPSLKFDDKVKGTLWIDDVSIAPRK